MTVDDQQAINEQKVGALFRVLSPERMATYVTAAGHDHARAAELYLWNARIGEAFHVAIQGVEVGLRNSINSALIAEYGEQWWSAQGYLSLIEHERQADLHTVFQRIKNRKLLLVNGQVVAGLSFGFWVGMLQPRYNPGLWSKHLKTAFPNLPKDRSRKSLAQAAGRIAYLRNRISHHEPLLRLDHSHQYKQVMDMLGWLCPVKRDWIRPHCRVPEIIRQRP